MQVRWPVVILQRLGSQPVGPLLPGGFGQTLYGTEPARVIEDERSSGLEPESDRGMRRTGGASRRPGKGEQATRHAQIHGDHPKVVESDDDILRSSFHRDHGVTPDLGCEVPAIFPQNVGLQDLDTSDALTDDRRTETLDDRLRLRKFGHVLPCIRGWNHSLSRRARSLQPMSLRKKAPSNSTRIAAARLALAADANVGATAVTASTRPPDVTSVSSRMVVPA